MTGYGRGECMLYGRKFSVEIKSVNHRYGEVSIKLPRILNSLEERVKKELNERVKRGKVDVYINFETFSKKDISVKVNSALCESYIDAMNSARTEFGLKDEVTLSLVSRLPDVFTIEKMPESEELLAEMWEALEASLKTALNKFIEMREREGIAIEKDLIEKHTIISSLTGKVAERAPFVVSEYEKRLRAALNEVLQDMSIDQNRIIQETLIYADRTCVDEELVRMKSHLSQFKEIIELGDAVGRKLDFLMQEINREINTIGSKSNDIELTRLVVDLKSELEKVREQIQNIE